VIKTIYRILKKKTIVGCREQQMLAVLWSRRLKVWKRLNVFIGSWFHCGIVYGKNECPYVSLEVWICLYVRGWYFLVLVSEAINMSDGTATRWNDTACGQKWFRFRHLPYIFHIKPFVFITFSWSHSLSDFHDFFSIKCRNKYIFFFVLFANNFISAFS
jgi:hypothetical protein